MKQTVPPNLDLVLCLAECFALSHARLPVPFLGVTTRMATNPKYGGWSQSKIRRLTGVLRRGKST